MKKGSERNLRGRKSLLNKVFRDKRGVDAWISWVLIMAFAVVLSVFMYQFMVDYAKQSTEDIKKVVYNTDECTRISLSINSVCFSSQALNITLQNRNYVRIDKIDFRLYNGRIPLHTNYTNITMNPNREKEMTIQTGITAMTMVEVIPHIVKEGMDIICSDKKVQSDVPGC
jgi:hypothetical protein